MVLIMHVGPNRILRNIFCLLFTDWNCLRGVSPIKLLYLLVSRSQNESVSYEFQCHFVLF